VRVEAVAATALELLGLDVSDHDQPALDAGGGGPLSAA
jgi:hypothetical protein